MHAADMMVVATVNGQQCFDINEHDTQSHACNWCYVKLSNPQADSLMFVNCNVRTQACDHTEETRGHTRAVQCDPCSMGHERSVRRVLSVCVVVCVCVRMWRNLTYLSNLRCVLMSCFMCTVDKVKMKMLC